MLRLSLIAVGIAGALSTAAAAQAFDPSSRPSEAPEPTSNASVTADTSATDPNKVICRNVRPPTGTRVKSSRTRTKLCMTKREWDEQAAEAQEATRSMDKRSIPPRNQ